MDVAGFLQISPHPEISQSMSVYSVSLHLNALLIQCSQLATASHVEKVAFHSSCTKSCTKAFLCVFFMGGGPTVRSLILRNRFLQIALKLLNTLLSSGEIPMRLRHLVAEIFAKNHSAKIVNKLQIVRPNTR